MSSTTEEENSNVISETNFFPELIKEFPNFLEPFQNSKIKELLSYCTDMSYKNDIIRTIKIITSKKYRESLKPNTVTELLYQCGKLCENSKEFRTLLVRKAKIFEFAFYILSTDAQNINAALWTIGMSIREVKIGSLIYKALVDISLEQIKKTAKSKIKEKYQIIHNSLRILYELSRPTLPLQKKHMYYICAQYRKIQKILVYILKEKDNNSTLQNGLYLMLGIIHEIIYWINLENFNPKKSLKTVKLFKFLSLIKNSSDDKETHRTIISMLWRLVNLSPTCCDEIFKHESLFNMVKDNREHWSDLILMALCRSTSEKNVKLMISIGIQEFILEYILNKRDISSTVIAYMSLLSLLKFCVSHSLWEYIDNINHGTQGNILEIIMNDANNETSDSDIKMVAKIVLKYINDQKEKHQKTEDQKFDIEDNEWEEIE